MQNNFESETESVVTQLDELYLRKDRKGVETAENSSPFSLLLLRTLEEEKLISYIDNKYLYRIKYGFFRQTVFFYLFSLLR